MTMRSRLAGLLLIVSLAFAAPTHAGTAAAPDFVDPADDVAVTVVSPPLSGVPFTEDAIDIVAGWIEADATNLYFNLQTTADPVNSDTGNSLTYTFHVTAGAAAVEVEATGTDDQPTLAEGSVATAVSRTGAVITFTVPRTALAGATQLTAIHAETTAEEIVPAPVLLGEDVGPDAGADSTVTYTVPPAAVTNPNDSDGDGLNNTFEQQYFGNATSPQTGAGDGDTDGLNNTREQQLGTDPTKADTDGDGVKDGQEGIDGTDPLKADTDGDGASDGAEKAAGTDPTSANSKPATTVTSTPTATSSSTSRTSTSATSTSTSGDGSFGDKLSADIDYAGISGGLFAVVLIICLIALFGRWAL